MRFTQPNMKAIPLRIFYRFDTFARDQRYLVERVGLQSYFGHPDNLSEGLNSGKSLTGKAGSE